MDSAAVWKFRLDATSETNVVYMPKGASVLHAAWQGDAPHVWALVDPMAPVEARPLYVLETGEIVENADMTKARYVGTCHAPESPPYVLHVFEEVS